MAIHDVIARLFGHRRTYVYGIRGAGARVLGMGPTELYHRQPALRAVVSFLADNVAGVPLKCYVRESDDDRPRDTTSVLAQLLLRPSPGMTCHELVRAVISDYLIYGSALCVALPDRGAQSGWSIRHMPWSWVESRETENGFDPSAYVVNNPYTGGRVTFDASDCIRFAQYDPAGTLDASSPIEALREVLSEQVSAWNFRNSVWRNGGRVSAYLFRPRDTPWGDGAKDRFAKSWKAKFSGEDGTDTGGTPLLEDGMELRTVQFNAREAEWAEATRLTREDVAAVYHVNPALVWHSEGQTYASAKDNARALYADTLSPIMDMVEERLNGFLVPMLGLDPARHYVEFDLSAKLAASFEEQAGVLQSSAGGPWMTRNEVRARMNLPAIEGGDELIVPLNVSEGGLAAPNDTDPTVERYSGRPKAIPAKDVRVETMLPFDEGPREVRVRVKASPKVTRELTDILTKFYIDQGRYLAVEMPKIPSDVVDLDAEIQGVVAARWSKWVKRLTDDIVEKSRVAMTGSAMRTLSLLGVDPDVLDPVHIDGYLNSLCEARAKGIVANSIKELKEDLSEVTDWTPGNVRRVVGKSIGGNMRARVERNVTSLATDVANAGAVEGARQSGVSCQKEWVALGHNTRDAHAHLSGVRVPIDGEFDVGGGAARWPGDSRLPAEQTCNCHCRIDIVSDGKAVYRRARTKQVAARLGLGDYDERSVEDATLRCQQRLGIGDRLWDDLTSDQKNRVIIELRSRDRDWIATGTCSATKAAANPAASTFKVDHPSEYADWQELVSRVPQLNTSSEQLKHIKGSSDFDGTSSYFVIDGADDDVMLAGLRSVVDSLAGTGKPYVMDGRLTEVVETDLLESRLLEANKPGDGFKIHYAPAQDGGAIHVVPWAHYIP